MGSIALFLNPRAFFFELERQAKAMWRVCFWNDHFGHFGRHGKIASSTSTNLVLGCFGRVPVLATVVALGR